MIDNGVRTSTGILRAELVYTVNNMHGKCSPRMSSMRYHQLDAAGRRAYVFIGGRSYRERVVLCGVLSETPPDGDRNSFSVCRYLLAGMMPFTNWEQLQLMLVSCKKPVFCFTVILF